MITLITGLPGAGKTLYTVGDILQGVIGTHVDKLEHDGTVSKFERRILTNINGLLLDHEKIDGDPEHGANGWHNWSRPGDFIVLDEVQKHWGPRANGSKVPDHIRELETHRHKGVDFVLLTQHPMLLDSNVRSLVGRHLHVRRLGGGKYVIVYEWDGCSNGLSYSKALKKSPWRYKSGIFKLYKSAELHTPQKHGMPGVIWIILASIVGMGYMGWRFTTHSQLTGGTKPVEMPQEQAKTVPGLAQQARQGVGQHQGDNSVFARPEPDNVILTGYLSGAGVNKAIFDWAPGGVYRASMSADNLKRHGIAVTFLGDCRVKLEQGTKVVELACVPGISPPVQRPESQDQGQQAREGKAPRTS